MLFFKIKFLYIIAWLFEVKKLYRLGAKPLNESIGICIIAHVRSKAFYMTNMS